MQRHTGDAKLGAQTLQGPTSYFNATPSQSYARAMRQRGRQYLSAENGSLYLSETCTRKTSGHAVAATKESALNSKDFGLTEPNIFSHRNVVLLSVTPEPLQLRAQTLDEV